ncbi:NAD(P)-dependent alcohol dehydrogenase [Gordonia sp. NB41Y]|uniref:NAD(P)-dependent alcohol dehydrogenase n=1 Tax=Gordonia sp. NB41Y TaxID=875808 RepID=UPI0006B165FE|nr:NAD(P)-dependent alcohol dehydrogenase [Gordonia sp. NB41Y]KOY49571.1 geraniol dehydrogenase [Gordonia sp. NB41Y]WLP89032.1 NAD(P)-dependent alcohol dehydrogenase [Gordonia sp. NB41Y]
MDVTAVVVPSVGAEFELSTVDLADPGPGEVRIKIAGVGLCHTDLAVKEGHLPFPLPGVLGHEGSGVIEAVGPGVTTLAVGDRVAVSFNSCGECKWCRRDEPASCAAFMPLNFGGVRPDGTSTVSIGGAPAGGNFFGQSSLATHAIANVRNVVRVPDDVPLELVGPLGCGVQTGAGAILNSLDVEPGSSVVISGAGSVGLSAVMAAAVRKAAHIVVVEPNADRRTLAIELGATAAIDPADGPVTEQLRAIVPDGFDYAADTTALVGVIGDLFGAMAIRGVIGLIGVPADPEATFGLPLVPASVLGISIRAIIEGDADPQTFIPHLLDLYKQGVFPFDKLITTMPLAEANEAVKAQLTGEAVKVVLLAD